MPFHTIDTWAQITPKEKQFLFIHSREAFSSDILWCVCNSQQSPYSWQLFSLLNYIYNPNPTLEYKLHVRRDLLILFFAVSGYIDNTHNVFVHNSSSWRFHLKEFCLLEDNSSSFGRCFLPFLRIQKSLFQILSRNILF